MRGLVAAGLCAWCLHPQGEVVAQEIPGVITTIAGKEEAEHAGLLLLVSDEQRAIEAELGRPVGVALDRHGNVYVAEPGYNMVRRVSAEGIITFLAGDSPVGSERRAEGVPATQTWLNAPYGIAVDAVGNVYIADSGLHLMRRVGVDGIIMNVAGTGEEGYAGDGGPARAAELKNPLGVAVDARGDIYVVDSGNHCVRRIDARGFIETVAGTQRGGYSGDGGAATDARLKDPAGMALDSDGNLYIADKGNHRIRRVGLDGVITTVAGTGRGGFSGDGELAVQAQLKDPTGVAVDADGNLYIADKGNHRVRRVGLGGVITTVAGTGRGGFSGDRQSAVQAQLRDPTGLAVDAEGNLYIADTGNHRIRRVSFSTEW